MKKQQELSEQVYQVLRRSKKQWTLEALSDKLDVGVSKIRDAVKKLEDEGKNVSVKGGVELLGEVPPSEPTVIDVSKFGFKHFKFGATADNHLGSKYARLDVLNALFDIWQEQGVKEVYQCGNMIDGEARFNKMDLLVPPGVNAQVDYFVENWPKREGVVTKFVTGDDHEGWYVQREGVNVGWMIEAKAKEVGRKDLIHLGYMEHDVILKSKEGFSVMRVIHAGGDRKS